MRAVYLTFAEDVQFENNLARFYVKEVFLSQEVCPDYVVIMEDGRPARVEAELFAANFRYHGHDPKKVDYIVACYSKSEQIDGVPVMAVHRLWCFDVEPLDCLPPTDPLSEEEAMLLSAIDQSGGVSISVFSQGKLGGDENIWVRIPPEKIAAIPRGRIEDSIMNILTQSAKEWLKKYHHLLLSSAKYSDENRYPSLEEAEDNSPGREPGVRSQNAMSPERATQFLAVVSL